MLTQSEYQTLREPDWVKLWYEQPVRAVKLMRLFRYHQSSEATARRTKDIRWWLWAALAGRPLPVAPKPAGDRSE